MNKIRFEIKMTHNIYGEICKHFTYRYEMADGIKVYSFPLSHSTINKSSEPHIKITADSDCKDTGFVSVSYNLYNNETNTILREKSDLSFQDQTTGNNPASLNLILTEQEQEIGHLRLEVSFKHLNDKLYESVFYYFI